MSDGVLPFMKLGPLARSPTRGSAASAGLDLYAAESVSVPPSGRVCVKTDIAMEIPFGYYGRIAARSGLALARGVAVGGGVVDSDYRGNIGVILFNLGEQAFEIAAGDRIAQLIIEKIVSLSPVCVQELASSDRGVGGFGSTGV